MSDPAPGLVAACFGIDLEADGWPSVSVVVPVRNEARHVEAAVESILSQAYPGDLDVCLAVAPSDDETAETATRIEATSGGRVRVVGNPAGITPAGLNAAVDATAGSIVVRVDGHAALSEGYIRRAVETMCRTGAVNVGGRQVPAPETPFEGAVAAATTSWMGTGGATYRVGGEPGPVDTVYLGVFDRAAAAAVGWFDETLIRNQDYELNIRLRAAGGVVWFDPELAVSYRPRGSWQALAKQYYEYGWWKAEVVRRYPASLKLRQLAPAMLAPASIAAFWPLMRVPRWAQLFGVVTVTFIAALTRSSARAWQVLPVMHFSWSIGFGASTLRRLADSRRRQLGRSRSRRSTAAGR